MFDKCFAEIEKQTGVKVSPLKAQEMRQMFEGAYLSAAKNMGPQEAVAAAADFVASTMMEQAKFTTLAKLNDAKAQQGMFRYMADHPEFTPAEAARRMLTDQYDLKAGRLTIEQQAKAIRQIEMSRIDAMFQEIGTKFGITLNKDSELLMIKALRGEELPPELNRLKELADEHVESFDALRKRLEATGVKIGEIDRYYAAQSWDPDYLNRAWQRHPDAKNLTTEDQRRAASREVFIEDMMQAADRGKYLDEAGLPMDDGQLAMYLGGAFDNIFLDADSVKTVQGPQLLRSQLGRKIHIKDAEWDQKLSSLYSGTNVLDSMLFTADRLAKAVALAENFGPNFERNVEDALSAARAAFKKDTTQQRAKKDTRQQGLLNRELNYFSRGESQLKGFMQESGRVLRAATNNLLGGAMITSLFGDIPLKAAILRMNKASGIGGILLDMPKMSKAELREQGLIAERFQASYVREIGEIPDRGLISFASTLSFRASLFPMLNRARLNAGREHMAEALKGKLSKYEWSQMTDVDGQILRDYGFTEADWAALKQLKTPYITSKAVLEAGLPRQLAEKVQGYLIGEIDIFMEPGLRTQAMLRGTTTAGTVGGELFRSATKFKTFVAIMMTQVYPRLWAAGDKGAMIGTGFAGSAVMASAFMIGSTIGGMVVEQAKALAAGRNPLDMTDPKVWFKASMTGGGLALLGDLIMASESRAGGGFGEMVLGAPMGLATSPIETALRPFHQAIDGRELDVGADLFRKVRSVTPFTTLWYTRAAFDRFMFDHVNEVLSPGYNSRREMRMQRDYGQSHWWNPGDPLPSELPDFSEAIQ